MADHDVLTNADLNSALFLEVLNEDQVEDQNSVHLRADRSNAPLPAGLNSAHLADDLRTALGHPASHLAAVVIPHVDPTAAEVVAQAEDVRRADAEGADAAVARCRRSIHRNSSIPTRSR